MSDTEERGFNEERLVFTCNYCKSPEHIRKIRASIMVPGEKTARGSMTAFVCKHCLETVSEMLHARIEWFDEKLQADTRFGMDSEDKKRT